MLYLSSLNSRRTRHIPMPIINIWWKCGCHYAIASVHNWWWILFLSLVVTSHQCQVSALTLGSRGQWPRQPRPGQPQHSLNPSGARADAASPLELETNLLEDSSFTITEKALSNYLSVSRRRGPSLWLWNFFFINWVKVRLPTASR